MSSSSRTRTGLMLGGLLGLVLLGCRQQPRPPAVSQPGPPEQAPPSAALLAGTASCSGRGCHAQLDDGGPPHYRSSYSRWLHHDPHANAFATLSSAAAKQMGEKLRIENVAEEPQCLVCHSTPLAARNDTWAKEERVFGVGCEACHGPAVKWLVPHRDKAWREMGPDQKQEHGMNGLESLSIRAKVCAGCHVGAPASPEEGVPARDVNHDLIAAGHPRLMFELGSFLANEPKHWIEKDTRPDFEARAWLVGQVVSAEAALKLLIDRTRPERVWPEFAEYDCYGCHHDLDRASWRQRGRRGRPGELRLSRWYSATVAPAARAPFTLEELERTMARRAPPPESVAAQAGTALEQLTGRAEAIEKGQLPRDELARLRAALARQGASREGADWDEVEQIALAIKALNESERAFRSRAGQPAGPRARQIEANTEALLRKLAFPPEYNSPLPFRRTATFDKELRALFAELE